MYRLQVKANKNWRWGLVEYASLEQAEERVAELKAVGITARIRESKELFENNCAKLQNTIDKRSQK